MKALRSFRNTLLFFLLINGLSQVHGQTTETVTYKAFYDALSPYGTWLHDASIGYVWKPNAGTTFRPYYSNGSWLMTEYGSTWISTYPWGWAPFHYGTWLYDVMYGWLWIPGTEWGPSWVVWRAGNDMYGWTPLVPGFSITQSFSPNYYVPADWWVFVPSKKLLTASFQPFSKSSASFSSTILKSTHVINGIYTANNTNYISGPRALDYTRATGEHIAVYSLKNASKPGKAMMGKQEITLYKPLVSKSGSVNDKPAKSVQAEHAIGQFTAIGAGNSAYKAGAKKKPATGSKAKTKKKVSN